MPNDKVTAQAVIHDYHARTKHHLQRYAAGPGTLDWDHQPNPFRHFAGAAQFPFGLHADALTSTYQQLYTPDAIAPFALNAQHLGVFFELSFALSAWKQYGTARWSLRCNPSSGNLHPTETYAVLVNTLDTLAAGVYHYCSDQHALEQRCRFNSSADTHGFLLGLSTIAWREAWKYGERAFRYCQLDTGHAIACADYAAACLGWRTQLVHDVNDAQIARLLGLDRNADFNNAERETPELLLWISPDGADAVPELTAFLSEAQQTAWQGQANLLDPRPMYQWPVIDEVTAASEKTDSDDVQTSPLSTARTHPLPSHAVNMAQLIRQRRSAQAYDGQTGIRTDAFVRLLDALMPRREYPVWRAWPYPAHIQPVFFIHRVEGLTPGLYIQVRNPAQLSALRTQLNPQFDWSTPGEGALQETFAQLGFYHLVTANAQAAARKYACHQDIASDSAFAVAMLAPLQDAVDTAAWHYRHLYWEAGMLGQVMYLEAEASDLRGTGIGCFFDDAIHQILGIQDARWQCLYQFTLGGALNDMRLISLPPYAGR
ncbi:MAG: nitroreductase [Gammaproteobacteria bacterium]|nr:nitroreductase [Gammaproteobacteria bacterium]